MSIIKHCDTLEQLHNECKDNLYDAQERIADFETSLYECNRISRSWKAQWKNLLHENVLLKKDNAYLLDILPVQKQQQYDSGIKVGQDRITELELAHAEALEMVCDIEEDAAKLRLALSDCKEKAKHWEATCHAQAETSHKAEHDCNRMTKALSEIREVWAGSDGRMPQTCPEGYLQRLVIQCYDIAVEALKK